MDTVSAPGGGIARRARWSLRLFGEFKLSELPGGEKVTVPGKRERVLLAYLAVSPDCRQLRRKLTTLLWGDAGDETALDNLRTCIFNLRKSLGDTEHRVISSDGRDIVLDAAAFEVDVVAFRGLAGQSATAELEAAANFYSGEFLEGLSIDSEEFESWRREEATRCRDRALDVLARLMTQLAKSGETERAIAAGLRILRLEPLHEAATRRLMRLYGETGRRGASIQLYRRLAETLRTELNAQPEAETRATFAEFVGGSGEQTSPAATDDKPSRHTTTMAGPSVSSGQSRDAAAVSAKPPPLDTRLARPSDPPGKPVQAPFRFRAPLAILVGVLIVAAALISFPPLASLGTRQSAVAERAAPASRASAISIAVLPFTNMSGDASQEFFSDGITEELTTALAKISELRVVARTSAFEFTGQNRNAKTIGKELGATYLLEGSVRKAGQRLRITVQLIKADDGTEIWSENYDREFSDVFAIQEDIAQAIAGALRIRLGLKPGERLVSSRSIDPESYQQYLRARPLMRARDTGVPQTVEILEPLVARNPEYAPALALLASSYVYMGFLDGENGIREFWPKAEEAARRAIELDPNLADAYFALARLQRVSGKLAEADDLLLKSLALDPNNPDALDLYMLHLSNVGRLKEALAIAQQLHALEPYVPTFNADVGRILWENGQSAAAIGILTPMIDTGAVRANLAMVYASTGRYAEGADILEPASGNSRLPHDVRESAREAAELLRTVPEKSVSTKTLPRFYSAGFPLDFVYLHVGASERVLESYEYRIKSGLVGGQGGSFGFLWHPSYAPVRKTERFKAFAREAGLVEYWRAKGWPEFCRPTSGDDFACH